MANKNSWAPVHRSLQIRFSGFCFFIYNMGELDLLLWALSHFYNFEIMRNWDKWDGERSGCFFSSSSSFIFIQRPYPLPLSTVPIVQKSTMWQLPIYCLSTPNSPFRTCSVVRALILKAFLLWMMGSCYILSVGGARGLIFLVVMLRWFCFLQLLLHSVFSTVGAEHRDPWWVHSPGLATTSLCPTPYTDTAHSLLCTALASPAMQSPDPPLHTYLERVAAAHTFSNACFVQQQRAPAGCTFPAIWLLQCSFLQLPPNGAQPPAASLAPQGFQHMQLSLPYQSVNYSHGLSQGVQIWAPWLVQLSAQPLLLSSPEFSLPLTSQPPLCS